MIKLDKATISNNAINFVNRWKSCKGEEDAEAKPFQQDLLEVFGLMVREDFSFEYPVTKYDGNRGKIDCFVPGKLIIEMKSASVKAPARLNEAFEQAEEYLNCLPNEEEIPRYILVCNFKKFILYDMSLTSAVEPISFTINDFSKKIRLFDFLIDKSSKSSQTEELALNMKASYMMGKLYDSFAKSGYDTNDLPTYLVRLLFCMFAEDTGVFGIQQFTDYIQENKADKLGEKLNALFEILDMSPEIRDKQTWLINDKVLSSFRYINGGLFHNKLSTVHYFSEEMRNTLLKCCQFDWSQVKPEIFGSLFQAVMDKDKRHDLGAHYTSEVNILKCLKPLFLDELRHKFNESKVNDKSLKDFYESLHKLKFLDSACGCGNFLIVAYRELRQLEIDALLAMRDRQQTVLDISGICQVNVDQFYGIEIEEFPCQIARVGMWLEDHLMNLKAYEELKGNFKGDDWLRLPLTKSAQIVHGDAVTLDWENICPDANYIMSNPPYLGYGKFKGKTKDEFLKIMVNQKGKTLHNAGKIDYVSAWFYKAAQYMKKHPGVHTALVATNSITQGEQVSYLWKSLYELFNIEIEFAYKTFVWKNGAKGEAKVHCVIIGFTNKEYARKKRIIFDESNNPTIHEKITPYLSDYPNILIESRTKPLCHVPEIRVGNRKDDDGALVINEEDYEEFIKKDPLSKKYIKRLIGGDEYLKGTIRYCLWLVNAEPSDIQKMPEVQKRIQLCAANRRNSPDPARQQRAEHGKAKLFREQMNPDSYIVVPKTSSGKRYWLPMGFLDSDFIPSDSAYIIIDGDLYLFGILMSHMHNAWMRYVCGRMKSDYSYSKDVVYNNFPFPQNITDTQKDDIKKLAQAVLDARANHPSSTLEAMYSSDSMPTDLLKAHEQLDKAVEKLYGRKFVDERDMVIYLLREYEKLSGVKEIL